MRNHRALLPAVLLLVLVALPGAALPRPPAASASVTASMTASASASASVTAAEEAGSVDRLYGSENRTFPTTRREVALTFNAAWDEAGLADVLRTLDRNRAPAVFFPTGRFAERHPDAVRAMARQHGVGSHSHNHPHFSRLTRAETEEEVTAADRALRATGTVPLPFFRFPYGETTPQAIAHVNSLGLADIEWTTDTKGYLGTPGGMSIQQAVKRVADVLRPGAVIQMHVGSADGSGEVLDAEALPQIIDLVRARGYEIADLRGLLRGGEERPR
ncbi:polysaccharide deacetylase family protein [Streptomyces huiliensis]|uniref:polysaccharide deacetylase family protein n=1 Tax=Streptomyces huiliensis TaxID=2876027 RepID=UPI001CBA8EFB|nr:polysaccharide deacetylase family protein [Streptomyces huiliensis]MBZ4319242.1 polysaccharide deacetylase family protein [Streptomyces huiliensis]